jgi:UDPglucose 6-dehydrogenase
MHITAAVDKVNDRQKTVLLPRIRAHFGERLTGSTIAVWGLAFKPRTDDIREAPALAMIDRLLEFGCRIQTHDPEAMENVRRQYGDKLAYFEQQYDALAGADALLIMTEWKEFNTPNFGRMKKLLKRPVIFDGRNIYDPVVMQEAGFTYHSIGRAPVLPA